MHYGGRPAGGWLLAALLACAAVLGGPAAAGAQTARIVAQLTPEAGLIADAAMLGQDHVLLLYPEEERIADFTLDGKLFQHIVREGGSSLRFHPVACVAAPDGTLRVFDEADHKLLFINLDGNITRGIDLAYPMEDGSLLALSTVGDITLGADGSLWTMLPDRGVLAGFDKSGGHIGSVELSTLLPYQPAIYTRAQLLSDGSLFVLDYFQGAVLYRRGESGQFRRLRVGAPEGLDAAPVLQDFAVDESGNVMLVTADPAAPLLLLTPGASGYESHTVQFGWPIAARRLACRYSGGRFIVWTRDAPALVVLELVP